MKRGLWIAVIAVASAWLCLAQPGAPSYRISTVAGVGIILGDGGPALQAQLAGPIGLAFDAAGNLYIADSGNHHVRKVSSNGIISTVAGTGAPGYNGDDQAATQAQLNSPTGVAVDNAGNLYVAEAEGHRVRRVTPAGIISTVAGTGAPGYNGDNGAASQARLANPCAVAVDAAGNVYIADRGNHRIRKVTPAGIITTVAGTGVAGYNGDNRPATQAQLFKPSAVAVDSGGNLYIMDNANARIRKVDSSGVITTAAGTGARGYNGDNRPATQAQLNLQSEQGGVALDSAGNLYIGESERVRKVTPAGRINTLVGGGSTFLMHGDSGAASQVALSPIGGLAADASGNVHYSEPYLAVVRKVTPENMVLSVAGASHLTGDGGPATAAGLFFPLDVALDTDGNLFIADSLNFAVRKVSSSGVIETVPEPGPLLPTAVSGDAAGNLYVMDTISFGVLKREPSGRVAVFAGGGNSVPGDGGPATAASLGLSDDGAGLAVDSTGNLYISEGHGGRIRKVTPAGIISTVAGTGQEGFSGDGGPAVRAQISGPAGVAVDTAGNLYIADKNNRRVRRVTPAGIIDTVAGNGSGDFSGDGGPATSAGMTPSAVAVDRAGNLYISGNGRVRKVTPDGVINTIAGTGTPGFSGDGGPATEAQFSGPNGLAVDAAGNIYIADEGNHRIRKLTPVPAPAIASGGVMNAASFEVGRAAPDSWVALFGTNLASKLVEADSTPPPTSLDGTSVSVTDSAGTERRAMLHFVAPGQVNFLVPAGTRIGSATVKVTTPGGSASMPLQVEGVAPGVFSANSDGAGVAAALAQRYTAAGPQPPELVFQYSATASRRVAVPIDLGGTSDQVILLLYGTGIRGFTSAVTATIGGQPAEVLGAAAQGQYAGLDQVNVRLPRTLAGRGEVPIELTVDGKKANLVSVNIR